MNKNLQRMSANYSLGQKLGEFTYDIPVMGKTSHFLPMTNGSCIENAQKLYMRKPTCIENSTFLYISFFTLLFSFN